MIIDRFRAAALAVFSIIAGYDNVPLKISQSGVMPELSSVGMREFMVPLAEKTQVKTPAIDCETLRATIRTLAHKYAKPCTAANYDGESGAKYCTRQRENLLDFQARLSARECTP